MVSPVSGSAGAAGGLTTEGNPNGRPSTRGALESPTQLASIDTQRIRHALRNIQSKGSGVMNTQDQPRAVGRTTERAEVIPGVGNAKALFMLAAGLSFLMSVYLFFSGNQEQGIFVGIWVPSILSAGALLLGSNGRE